MQAMTEEDLLERYIAGERDFQGVILSDILLGRGRGDSVNLERVDFFGAIFKKILIERYPTTNVTIGSRFTNCNFSRSKWEFCQMPALIGCNLQYSVMEGCFFSGRFVDCNWRYGQIIGQYVDEFIFERCDLRGLRRSDGASIGQIGDYIRNAGFYGNGYVNTIDPDGVFHSGIYCDLARPDPEEIPF